MIRNSIYYPACSVGVFLNTLIKNIKYNEKSFRFYNKEESPFFEYPYLLVSAGHNYKRNDFRNTLNFPDNNTLFVDSGGFQLATGSIKEEKFNDKIALEWSEQNGNIFPILDRPPFVTGILGISSEEKFKECLKKSVISAKYYSEKRTKNNIILNVLQGRTIKEKENWYSLISKFPFEGWAQGGNFTLSEMISSFLFLKNKGEFNRKNTSYYHILGVSKFRFIIYIEFLQHLINKNNLDIIVSFDSSYPLKTTAFGHYFLFPTFQGMKQFSFSNKWKEIYDKKLNDNHKLPCDCAVCNSVKDIKEMLGVSEKFYNLVSAHNLLKMINYKIVVENLIFMDIPEIWNECFDYTINKNLKIIKNAFLITDMNEMVGYLKTHLIEEEEMLNGNIGELF